MCRHNNIEKKNETVEMATLGDNMRIDISGFGGYHLTSRRAAITL